MRMAVQHRKCSTVTQMALSRTRCTDVYSSMTYITLQVPQDVYTSYGDKCCPVYKCTIPKACMVVHHTKWITQMQTAFSKVHLLYGSVQLNDIHRLTGTTDCVHKSGGSMAPIMSLKRNMALPNSKVITMIQSAFS